MKNYFEKMIHWRNFVAKKKKTKKTAMQDVEHSAVAVVELFGLNERT